MKTLILGPKTRLYVKSQGVACNVTATTHLMEFTTTSNNYPDGGGEENYERIFYSTPQLNSVNTLVEYATEGRRVIKEIYLYNNANSAQVYSLHIRTYTNITLLAGTDAGKLDDPANYIDTCLIDVSISALKVWRLSEAFLLSYPSVIVLDNGNIGEISIVTAPVSGQTLTADDHVHVTMSHGVTGQTTWGIDEQITQKITNGTGVLSIYKLPTSASFIATVIKQICVYNSSAKTVHVKLGFGPATSTDLQGYVFDGNLAPNQSWWSDGSTYQKIEDYIAASVGSVGAGTVNPISPLAYSASGNSLRIAQSGATNGQVLGWDATALEWRPQDNLEVLTPTYPLEYNMSTLKLLIGKNGAVDGQGLVWSAVNNRWQPGTIGAPSAGSTGLVIDGDSY